MPAVPSLRLSLAAACRPPPHRIRRRCGCLPGPTSREGGSCRQLSAMNLNCRTLGKTVTLEWLLSMNWRLLQVNRSPCHSPGQFTLKTAQPDSQLQTGVSGGGAQGHLPPALFPGCVPPALRRQSHLHGREGRPPWQPDCGWGPWVRPGHPLPRAAGPRGGSGRLRLRAGLPAPRQQRVLWSSCAEFRPSPRAPGWGERRCWACPGRQVSPEVGEHAWSRATRRSASAGSTPVPRLKGDIHALTLERGGSRSLTVSL